MPIHLVDLNFEVGNCSALMVLREKHRQIRMTPGCTNPAARPAGSVLPSMTLAKALTLPFRFVLGSPSRLILLLELVLPNSVVGAIAVAAAEEADSGCWSAAHFSLPCLHDGLIPSDRLRACCRCLNLPSTPKLRTKSQKDR